MEIRNIAIIAHVDHGKTAITDALMKQSGMFVEGMSMDTDKIEKERGITIYAKNTSLFYKDTKINIVDTPGHADFGSEVERVLRSIDSVLLVVDAQEGPMPQTRFVLKKSLELGLKPIVVINKIDKPAANPKQAEEDVFELFMELGASEEQLDFKTVYAVGRDGIAKRKLEDESKDLTPLLDTILETVPPAPADLSVPARAQVFNLGYDNFLGRLAICRIYDGVLKDGESIFVKKATGETRKAKITKLFSFKGLSRDEVKEVIAGDIMMIAGLPDVFIGETITTDESTEPMPAIKVDEPTITLDFLVNNSPFAGKEGKYVTGRQIQERLERELEVNVGLKIDTSEGILKVAGRGELHIAVLLENMRREGYEMQVSQPQIIIKEEDGVKLEPFEEVTIDVPLEFQGAVIEKLGRRKGILSNMRQHENTARLIFEIPTRGLLGYRGQFVVDTKGEGILSSRVVGFKKYAGEITKRVTGSMISMVTGKALGFSLYNLQDRGELYIGANTEVYEGMVIGSTSKGEEMAVNPIKGKQLTNMRASGSDENIVLFPPKKITIESGLETMVDDEYLEITPSNVRLRKKYLTETERSKNKRK
ncbi:GTP-binding protein TypA [Candidatus Campbellbacteria bacterium RIFCSPLOWO2_02_FULL_35_11]|uniref:50S ribosomal subunit assembly factor BipA n=2 Tax=Candidatus Campbelliibacteriota TaxID=1752727 RepID=A0A1F5ENP7_9BACT|nr:MAG: GTP-binding protein TypA [Candidatus Campbellbacteria bacterium RIFCSPHIGHO2_12_FULL_35_10]OGD70060.1 MAG: GTP-binding protein TypA [Candidatus Campbellbacteria bacterium RIFCSPLOWO2_02_FULL_35_11]